MAVVVTIAGVDKSSMIDEFTRERGININTVARLIVSDPLGVYIPAERAPVVITIDGVVKFKGVIVRSTVTFWSEEGKSGVTTAVDALGGNFLLQRIIVNGIMAPGTLKEALEQMPLSAAGVTLDAGQADGPDLDTLTFPWTRVDAALMYLSTLSAYVFDVDVTDTLKMWLIGSVSSGVTFSTANGNVHGATWGRDALDYRNYQILVFGPSSTLEKTDSFTADGVATSWPLSYHTHVSNRGYVTVGGADLTLVDAPDALQWAVVANALPLAFNQPSHTLYAPTGGVAPADTTVLSLIATFQFPDYVISEDAVDRAANGDWVAKDESSQITEADEAQAYADALRRRYKVVPKTPTIPSKVEEVTPGQTAIITIAPLGLSLTYLAVSSRVTYARAALPAYSTSFISGEERPQHFAEWWMQKGGAGSSGSGGASGGGITPVSTGPIFAYLGGSLDFGVTGATSGRARSAVPVKGAPYDGRTVTPFVTGRVENAGETMTPIIKDEAGTVVSTGTAITATTDTEQGLPTVEMAAGSTYYLSWTLGAVTHTGYLNGYFYA